MTVISLSLNPGVRQRQAGYTLIELSISLAIISVLLVGTLTGVQRLLRSNNANNTVSQTQSALTNISKLFSASGDVNVYDHSTLAKMGAWEASSLIKVGTAAPTGAKNPFGGTITVYRNQTAFTGVTADTGYWYRLNGIPAESCASLATSFVNTAEAIFVTSAPVTTTAAPTVVTGAYKAGPTAALEAAKLSAGCSTTATDGTVNISLYIPS
jgi:prepilin-type N-terminal cleavage/methylation domain-containing protein